MKKKSFLLILAIILPFSFLFSQNAPSSESEVLFKVLVPKQEMPQFDDASKQILEQRLQKMLSDYALATRDANAPFTLSAKVILDKFETIAGATPKVVAKLEITLFADDTKSKKNYASISMKCTGVSENEPKALQEAMKSLKTKNPKLDKFFADAKLKICEAYKLECTQVAANEVVTNNNPKKDEVKKQTVEKSDVDVNIPTTSSSKSRTFALVIGNEDYTTYQTSLNSEVNVDFAKNDANAFKEYLVKTLGVPEQNVTLITNGTLGQMKQAITKLGKLAEVSNGEAELIFYYSGHGLPDEQTKEGYIMPVDISGTEILSAIKVSDLYKQLLANPSKRVSVFLDACFSGGGRNQGLVAMKGVKIKAKEEQLQGNLIVLSSSTGEESSAVYRDKQHGLFTYFLLKKIQETKGEVTYKDLTDYVVENVKLQSVLINNKTQTPQVNGSPSVSETWGSWKLK